MEPKYANLLLHWALNLNQLHIVIVDGSLAEQKPIQNENSYVLIHLVGTEILPTKIEFCPVHYASMSKCHREFLCSYLPCRQPWKVLGCSLSLTYYQIWPLC